MSILKQSEADRTSLFAEGTSAASIIRDAPLQQGVYLRAVRLLDGSGPAFGRMPEDPVGHLGQAIAAVGAHLFAENLSARSSSIIAELKGGTNSRLSLLRYVLQPIQPRRRSAVLSRIGNRSKSIAVTGVPSGTALD